MATIIYAGRIEKGRQYVELAGLSTETKPTRGILNGSKFHESDTDAGMTAVYLRKR